jgi:hypothetical protein
MFERDPFRELPGTAQIFPNEQSRGGAGTLREGAVQGPVKLSRNVPRRLVLDRDVRVPSLAVLPRNSTAHRNPYLIPQSIELRGLDVHGDAGAEKDEAVEENRNRGARRLEGLQPEHLLRRQSVKHRQMRRQEIPFWRKVLATKSIEPSEAFFIQFRGENGRACNGRPSRWLPR